MKKKTLPDGSCVSACLVCDPGRHSGESRYAVQQGSPDGKTLLREALEQVRQAGGYHMTLDVQQTVLPAGAIGEQSARFRIEGDIAGPQKARLTLRDGQVRGAFSSTPLLTSSKDQEILISEGVVYQRVGDAWEKQPEALVTPGLSSDSLVLLEVARDVLLLEPVETLAVLLSVSPSRWKLEMSCASC